MSLIFSAILGADQHEVESVAFAALEDWAADVMGAPVHGLISNGVGKALLAQMGSGQTPEAARASQTLLGTIRRDDFGPDGPSGPREYVVDTVAEIFPPVAQIRMRTEESYPPGTLTLYVSMTPRAAILDMQPSLAWWRERTDRLRDDVAKLDS